jgi:DNA-binding phage protein
MPQPDTTPTEAINAEIRAQLGRKRRTVSELAAHVGVSEATLYRRLNEGAGWTLEEISAAADFFKLTFWQFLQLSQQDSAA